MMTIQQAREVALLSSPMPQVAHAALEAAFARIDELELDRRESALLTTLCEIRDILEEGLPTRPTLTQLPQILRDRLVAQQLDSRKQAETIDG